MVRPDVWRLVLIMVSRKTSGDGVRLIVDKLDVLKRDIMDLTRVEVLVGFPEETTNRNGPEEVVTNALLGYTHDQGAPERNIPARPFMIPGILAAREQIARSLFMTARAVMKRSMTKGMGDSLVEEGYHRVGLIAQAALRNKINEGIPPPLSEYTLRERAARGRKGAAMELENRKQGMEPSTQLAKPLIDTGQMRNAVNYVIRDRKKRKR